MPSYSLRQLCRTISQVCFKAKIALLIKVKHIGVYYWKEKHPGQYSADNGFPAMSKFPKEDLTQGIYCIPSIDYPGYVKVWVKLCNDYEHKS